MGSSTAPQCRHLGATKVCLCERCTSSLPSTAPLSRCRPPARPRRPRRSELQFGTYIFRPCTRHTIILSRGDHGGRPRGAPWGAPGCFGVFTGPMEQRGGVARVSFGLWGAGGGRGETETNHACDRFLFGGHKRAPARAERSSIRQQRQRPSRHNAAGVPVAAAADCETGTPRPRVHMHTCMCCTCSSRT